jgi:hypothetical protein
MLHCLDRKNIKLKLEFAEKYNEDAKSREKENREEMNRLRSSHEEALKEMRLKAESELKDKVCERGWGGACYGFLCVVFMWEGVTDRDRDSDRDE